MSPKSFDELHDFVQDRVDAGESLLPHQDLAWPELPTVAGRTLTTSIIAFARSCLVLIAEEQRKVAPDSHLIGVLCDAVRFAREHCDVMRYVFQGEPDGAALVREFAAKVHRVNPNHYIGKLDGVLVTAIELAERFLATRQRGG
jgi:hypothetical protein